MDNILAFLVNYRKCQAMLYEGRNQRVRTIITMKFIARSVRQSNN